MRKFKSPMVNEENYKFVAGHPGYRWTPEDPRFNRGAMALINRVVKGKKPFASVVLHTNHPKRNPKSLSEFNKKDVMQLYNKLKKRKDIAVSPIEHEYAEEPYQFNHHYFKISRKGTLRDNFDLKALAEHYRRAGLPTVADDIPKKARFTLPSYFKDWDWQDRYLEMEGRSYLKEGDFREPPVEPWETGLILGYPIDSTIEIIYFGAGYDDADDWESEEDDDYL